jgi:hypothetical protein
VTRKLASIYSPRFLGLRDYLTPTAFRLLPLDGSAFLRKNKRMKSHATVQCGESVRLNLGEVADSISISKPTGTD